MKRALCGLALLLWGCADGVDEVVVPSNDSTPPAAHLLVGGVRDTPIRVDGGSGPIEAALPTDGYDLTVLAIGEDRDGVKEVEVLADWALWCINPQGQIYLHTTARYGEDHAAEPEIGPGEVALDRLATGLRYRLNIDEIADAAHCLLSGQQGPIITRDPAIHRLEVVFHGRAQNFHGGESTTPTFSVIYPQGSQRP